VQATVRFRCNGSPSSAFTARSRPSSRKAPARGKHQRRPRVASSPADDRKIDAAADFTCVIRAQFCRRQNAHLLLLTAQCFSGQLASPPDDLASRLYTTITETVLAVTTVSTGWFSARVRSPHNRHQRCSASGCWTATPPAADQLPIAYSRHSERTRSSAASDRSGSTTDGRRAIQVSGQWNRALRSEHTQRRLRTLTHSRSC